MILTLIMKPCPSWFQKVPTPASVW